MALQTVLAKLTDARIVADICRQSWMERYPDFMPVRPLRLDTRPDLARWIRTLLDEPGGGAFLAIAGGCPVGAAVFRCKAGQIELQQFFVLPAFQKTGAGLALFRALQNMAARRGARIWLLAARHNHRARAWYEARGGRAHRSARITWNRYQLPLVRYHW